MKNMSESEESSTDSPTPKITVGFWQTFLLILSGTTGLISMVVDGPRWLTYSGLGLTVVILLWVIFGRAKRAK
jgi:hypothetical protein